jgi:hypothetical protein
MASGMASWIVFTRKIRLEPDCLAGVSGEGERAGVGVSSPDRTFCPYREITTFRPPRH